MKIVIAGATGFIGQSLTRALLDEHHSVVALTRKSGVAGAQNQPHLEYIHWDGRTVGAWSHSVDGADAVINLCGESIAAKRWSADRKQLLYSSRIDPSHALVEAIKASKERPSVFLNASAVGYYGETRDDLVAEDRPPGRDFLSDLCVRWESAVKGLSESGVRVALLRTGIVLDPNSGALQRLLLPFRMFVGGPLGSGRQWLPWIHKDDEIRSILFVLGRKDISGPVNLAAPESVTMRDFCDALGKALHRPSALAAPSFLLRAILGEMSWIVLTGQRIMPTKLMEAGYSFHFPSLSGALADLLK